MRNLAGQKDADRHIRSELERCGIEVVQHPEPIRSEVPMSLTGCLGPFKFERRWYYWAVEGNVPLGVAKALYEDRVGREDIRANGHCACPDPETQITWIDEEGRKLIPQAELDKYGPDSHVRKTIMSMPDCRVVEDITKGIPVIDVYHIDSELGLYIFVQHIKKYLEGLCQ